MNTKLLSIFGVLMFFGTTATAFAGPEHATELERLREKREEVVMGSKLIGGGARLRLNSERARLDELIRDLESGRSVNPSEIDRAVEGETLLH